MLALIILTALRQSDITSDLEQALTGKQLSGSAFHQAIDPVLDKYGALQSVKFQRTVGDNRGLMMTLTGSGPNWDGMKAWRVFVWPESNRIRAQVIKRFGDFTTSAIDFYTDGQIYWRVDRLTIAGHDYDGSTTSRAGLTDYVLDGGRWKLAQHVSSERQGEAAFARLDQAVDPSRVLVKTRLRPDHFRVSAQGPMLTFTQTWMLKQGQYEKSADTQVDTAVAALDQLVGFAQKKDRASFNKIAGSFADKLWAPLSADNVFVESADKVDPDASAKFDLGKNGPVVTMQKNDGAWSVASVQ